MFYRPGIGRDASKVALAALVNLLQRAGAEDRLLDVQWLTPHLESLGAVAVPRPEYLQSARGCPPPSRAGLVQLERLKRQSRNVNTAVHNGPMPEMPEVESLARFLTESVLGVRSIASILSLSARSRPTIHRCPR